MNLTGHGTGSIYLTILLSLVLSILPLPSLLDMYRPDWVALVVIFWGIREPRLVGMGWAFLLGLAMDVADASVLGQHALAYVLAAYGATTLSRRVLWFPLLQQALHVLPLLLLVQLVQLCVRAMPGLAFPGWTYFAGPFVGAALWLPLTFLLLLPQHQPVDRDANRPI